MSRPERSEFHCPSLSSNSKKDRILEANERIYLLLLEPGVSAERFAKAIEDICESYHLLKSQKTTLFNKMVELYECLKRGGSWTQFSQILSNARRSNLHLAYALLIAHKRLCSRDGSRNNYRSTSYKGPGRWSL